MYKLNLTPIDLDIDQEFTKTLTAESNFGITKFIPTVISDMTSSVTNMYKNASVIDIELINAVLSNDTPPFMKIKSVIILTPENFKGNLLNYSNDLLSIIREHTVDTDRAIDELTNIASKIINLNSPDTVMMELDSHKEFSKRMKSRKDILKTYYKKSGKTLQRVSAVFGNMVNIGDFLKSMKVTERINDIDYLKSVDENVNDLSDLLEMIRKGDNFDKLADLRKDLSTYIYTVAKMVEFTSVLSYDYKVLKRVTKDVMKKI